MKACYGQIRDEHVQLLRKNAEATKQTLCLQSDILKMKTENEILNAQIEEYQEKEKKFEINFKQSLENREKLELYIKKYDKINLANEAEIVKISQKYETLILQKDKEFIEKEIELTKKIRNFEIDNDCLKTENEAINNEFHLLKLDHETLEATSKIERFNLAEKSEEVENLKKQLEEILSENKNIKQQYQIELEDSMAKCSQKLKTKFLEFETLEKRHNQLMINYQEIENSFKVMRVNINLFRIL